jgi:hypothetical protein
MFLMATPHKALLLLRLGAKSMSAPKHRLTLVLVLVSLLASAHVGAEFMYGGDEISGSQTVTSGGGMYQLKLFFENDPSYGVENLFACLVYIGPGSPSYPWCTRSDAVDGADGYGYHSNQWTLVNRTGRLLMQLDGNLVLYRSADHGGAAGWASATDGNSGAYLNVQDDANMVIYSPNDVPLWSVWGAP